MLVRTFVAVYTTICVRRTLCEMRDFTLCHEDYRFELKDGVLPYHSFNWLGFFQYVHVQSGIPHPDVAPRIILIHKQLILTSARAVSRLPRHHKIGNVFFGDYELDENNCGLTEQQLKNKEKCPRAYLEVPIAKIDVHPEYSRFGVQNSLAIGKLLTPMKSSYMVPVCIPALRNRYKLTKEKKVYLVDYISVFPRNFQDERMALKTLKLFNHKNCERHRKDARLPPEGITNLLCTTGCGVRDGSPIISRSTDGRFELVGLAAGGGPCHNATFRRKLNPNPPIYMDIYPYNSWIINIVTAHARPLAYSSKQSNGMLTSRYSLRSKKTQKSDWSGKMFMAGDKCFESQSVQESETSFIYTEDFAANQVHQFPLKFTMIIDGGIECIIVCVKILLPNTKYKPPIKGLGTRSVEILIKTKSMPQDFVFTIMVTGINATAPLP